jgi:hypothetical protein
VLRAQIEQRNARELALIHREADSVKARL